MLANAVLSDLGLGCASVASTATETSGAGEQGLASGLLNTSAQLGTALGLALLVAVAASRSEALSADGVPNPEAQVKGFRLAFLAGAGIAVAGCVAALSIVRGEIRKGAELET